MHDATALSAARERLLAVALDHFAACPDVLGVFLGGSLAAGTFDEFSDIDMRVVVTPESHSQFVVRRREIPAAWPGFLFTEWIPGTHHCVAHFLPFGKIDIFYHNLEALRPSPWYGLPIRVLHDPKGVVADLLDRSQPLRFSVSEEDVDFSISKGRAAAHEIYRRAMRGELFYAQTLLDELRQHVMQADDWLYDRTPEAAVLAKFDKRASDEVRRALTVSYPPYDAAAILTTLRLLLRVYRQQVYSLHNKYKLPRSFDNVMTAVGSVENALVHI